MCKEKNIFKILEWPQDMGTEAPTLVDFNFPRDGEYRFQMCGFVSFRIGLVFVCCNYSAWRRNTCSGLTHRRGMLLASEDVVWMPDKSCQDLMCVRCGNEKHNTQ